jgi:hypothetical protein
MNPDPKEDPLVRDERLLQAIKAHIAELEQLKSDFTRDYEDRIYRFYHQSFKVFSLQSRTQMARALFLRIGGGRPLNEWFEAIVSQGTGRQMQEDTNDHWPEHTRPVLEAFFHAKYFVDMMVEHAGKLESAPSCMPSGWAAILELYGQR